MNSYGSVSERMDHIQKLFLGVGAFFENKPGLKEIIDFLETQSPEYRSVAFESASFEIALADLESNHHLDDWQEFKNASAGQHTFHIDIGLGWAFAKAGLSPEAYLHSKSSLEKWMVFDGIGYYYSLFKGRATLKNKIVPDDIESEGLHGFDQGVGRRIWYTVKGNVSEAVGLLQSFPAERHADLFRGIGIACGYVGGNQENNLRSLANFSGEHYQQLQTGILLAAISRVASNTLNESIDNACCIICNKTVNEIRVKMISTTTNFFYLYKNSANDNLWLTRLQSELLQTS